MPLPQALSCGPAGWAYPHWNGSVYPAAKTHHVHALEYISQYFDVVEINTSFYQPLRPEITRLWICKAAGNPRFLFTAKLHRRFTHDRALEPAEVARFKEGMWPLLSARKLGCLLVQFPWTFRYTEENRNYLIQVRRAFHEFPLVTEMRHSSWAQDEALGMLVDYRIGFCNIDQAAYTKAMPPTAHLTSEIGYVRMHGRNPLDWMPLSTQPAARHDYLYSEAELIEWKARIDQIVRFAARTFVITNNDVGAKSVVNGLQFAAIFGDDRRIAPAGLIRKYPLELTSYHSVQPFQTHLFERAVA